MADLIFDIDNSIDENLNKFRESLELIDQDFANILFKNLDILRNESDETHGGRNNFNKNVLTELEVYEATGKKDTE
jgi:hypothetical protein